MASGSGPTRIRFYKKKKNKKIIDSVKFFIVGEICRRCNFLSVKLSVGESFGR
jgi:hypothetical protein